MMMLDIGGSTTSNHYSRSFRMKALLFLLFLHTTNMVTGQIQLPHKIDNMAMDKSNNIFVTAGESLYKISQMLEESEHLSISLCRDFNYGCDGNVDNTLDEILVLDKENGDLVQCNGEGICLRYPNGNLDLNKTDLLTLKPQISRIEKGSLISTQLSPGALSNKGTLDVASRKLVLGTKDRERKHTLSKCILTYHKVSLVSYDDKQVLQNSTYQCADDVKLIYAFSYDNQDVTIGLHNEETVMTISKANTDDNPHIIKESVLKCSNEGVKYNMIKLAQITDIGLDLANALGLGGTSKVLFGIFANNRDDSMALCMYPLSVFPSFFSNTRYGELEYSNDKSSKAMYNVMTFPPLEAYASINIPMHVTSFTITSSHTFTVVFFGMENGRVKKFEIESASKMREYQNSMISDGEPIDPIMLFDQSQSYLYFTSGNSIHKASVGYCEEYKNYNDCHEGKNPFCGWCYREGKCVASNLCNMGRLGWKPYSQEPVRILGVSSLEGDPTSLVIQIENIPIGSFYKCAFTYEDKTMQSNAYITFSDSRSNVKHMQCRIKPANRIRTNIHEEQLSLFLDGTDMPLKTLRLLNRRLEKPPIVERLPPVAFTKGSVAQFIGQRFDQVSNAILRFSFNKEDYVVHCNTVNMNVINCEVPSFESYFEQFREMDYPFQLYYTFVIRWDEQKWGAHSMSKAGVLSLYPEPKFTNFTKTDSGYLLLRGNFLSSIFSSRDYTITLGETTCDILLLLDTFLRCSLANNPQVPDPQTESVDTEHRLKSSSLIHIKAGVFNWTLGQAGMFDIAESLESPPTDKSEMFIVYILIVVGVVFILSISIGFVVFYSNRKETLYKFDKEDKHKEFLSELMYNNNYYSRTTAPNSDPNTRYLISDNNNDNEYLKLGYFDSHSNRNSALDDTLLDIKLQYLDAHRPLDDSVEPKDAPLAPYEELSDDLGDSDL